MLMYFSLLLLQYQYPTQTTLLKPENQKATTLEIPFFNNLKHM